MSLEVEEGSPLELLACPICRIIVPDTEYLLCPNSHNICLHCQVRVNNTCPQCSVPYQEPAMRNRVLEQMIERIEDLHLHCKNYSRNCTFRGKKSERLAHQEQCAILDVFCPGVHCREKLSPDHVKRHIKRNHSAMEAEIPENATISVKLFGKDGFGNGNESSVLILNVNAVQFYLCLSIYNEAILIYVSTNASREEAERFNVKFSLGRSQSEKLVKICPVPSLAESKDNLISSGLVITRALARSVWQTVNSFNEITGTMSYHHQVHLDTTIINCK